MTKKAGENKYPDIRTLYYQQFGQEQKNLAERQKKLNSQDISSFFYALRDNGADLKTNSEYHF